MPQLTLEQGQTYFDNSDNIDLKNFYNNPDNAALLTKPDGIKLTEAEYGQRHHTNFVNPETVLPGVTPEVRSISAGGGDGVVVPPAGGGGMMSGPVGLEAGALSPVTSLIGTPGTGQTGTQATLMGQTAGLATGQQGIRDVVNPIGEQVTALQSTVNPLAANIDTVKSNVTDLGTNVGTATANTGLYAPISTLQSAVGTQVDGQPNLLAGQKDLTTDVGAVQTGVNTLNTNMGVPLDTVGSPQTLFEGQGLMQDSIGKKAGEETPATGLYAGQAGLMSNQTGLGTQLTGVGADLTAGLGDVSSVLGGQIGAFRTAAEDYQRGATTQRGSIQGDQVSNQANMLAQVQGIAQPINRQADMLAAQRGQEATSFAASQAPLQEQIATLTANNASQAANNQPIGPLGPMGADPRDALIQQLLTRNASLMNNRPV
jgi:hypothetical protein